MSERAGMRTIGNFIGNLRELVSKVGKYLLRVYLRGNISRAPLKNMTNEKYLTYVRLCVFIIYRIYIYICRRRFGKFRRLQSA